MYRRPWGGHWLQVWDTKHCTFRMSFPYIYIPASTYTYRTYSYLCLYTYTHTWNHSVKSHGAEFEWSHTKMSESLKPGLQQPHECLLRTALVQTLLPAAPRVLFVLFSARLLFFFVLITSVRVSVSVSAQLTVNFCRKVLHVVQAG